MSGNSVTAVSVVLSLCQQRYCGGKYDVAVGLLMYDMIEDTGYYEGGELDRGLVLVVDDVVTVMTGEKWDGRRDAGLNDV